MITNELLIEALEIAKNNFDYDAEYHKSEAIEEYLKAKFDLCINQAEKDLKEQDIAQAIKNLQRANSAMSRLFGIESQDESE